MLVEDVDTFFLPRYSRISKHKAVRTTLYEKKGRSNLPLCFKLQIIPKLQASENLQAHLHFVKYLAIPYRAEVDTEYLSVDSGLGNSLTCKLSISMPHQRRERYSDHFMSI